MRTVVVSIAGLMAVIFAAPIFAAAFNCYTITGEVPYAILEAHGCSFLDLPDIDKHCPGLKFKASSSTAPSCFVGTLTGTTKPLSGVATQEVVTGTFYAAQTENPFIFSEITAAAATAATVLQLAGSKRWTGTLYFKDVINPLTLMAEEILTFVNGDKPFETVKTEGTLVIHGNALFLALAYNPVQPPPPRVVQC